MFSVLLIEDQYPLFFDMLSLYGYEVDVAEDGFEGLQKLQDSSKRYDLVILDIELPRLNGWEVLKVLRGKPETAEMPVIILTCHNNEDAVITGLHHGADLYLVKPVTPRTLLAHIEALMRRVRRGSGNGRQNADASNFILASTALSGLTGREKEILALLVKGFSNQRIAEELVISETTVKNHLANIFKKLKVSNRTQAAYLAQSLNLVE